jgi:hypothetical protein
MKRCIDLCSCAISGPATKSIHFGRHATGDAQRYHQRLVRLGAVCPPPEIQKPPRVARIAMPGDIIIQFDVPADSGEMFIILDGNRL